MGLRKIVVQGKTFLWKREHFHLSTYKISPCNEKITVYLEGKKKSSLRLIFRSDDNLLIDGTDEQKQWCINEGLAEGYVWKSNTGFMFNLNRPVIIKELIEYALNIGWDPEHSKQPFVPERALEWLEKVKLTRETN